MRPVARQVARSRPAPRGARRPGATGSPPPRRGRPARRARAAWPGRGGRAPVDGATSRAQTSARVAGRERAGRGCTAPPAVPDDRLAPRTRARSHRQALRQPSTRSRPEPASRSSSAPPAGQQELGRRQQRDLADRLPTLRWSVGSNARSESISSPKNSIRIGQGGRGREHVHDAAAPRELAATRDLDHRRVAALEQLARAGRPARSGSPGRRVREPLRQVVGRECRLEQCLDACDEDPRACPPARPRAPRPGPPSRRATSSLRSYASEVRGSRTATSDGSPSQAPSSSATRSPISASRATQQIRSPSSASASAAAR